MGHPRRDAFEYGVLITLGTGMAAAYAFLIAYSSKRAPDGTRQRLPKVDLDETVDLGKAWEEFKAGANAVRRGERPMFPSDAGANNANSAADAARRTDGDDSKK
mmetsp:Transcript_8656/g.13679  ORF Transcript_8656/g.13679 Transcript_8656/m.13679 type:complete len:104 (-) Transcript_8656:1160-1471(-)